MKTFLVFVVLIIAISDAELDSRIKRVENPITNKYIVILKDSSDVDSVTQQISSITGPNSIGRVFKNVLKGVTLSVQDSQVLTKVLDKVNGIKYVQQDGLVNVTAPPGDTGLHDIAMTWGLDRINQRKLPLDGKVSFTGNGSGVNVYVIDTGIYPDHVFFGGRARVAVDIVETDDQHGIDCHGHGTHCAGTVGADHYGIARGANLWGVRVIDCYGWGEWSWIIAGMDWVAANHIAPAVASISLGGGASQAVDDAIRSLFDMGVTAVVAGGNFADDACHHSPARESTAITVGATDKTDYKAGFSCFGSCIDIFAPGVDVLSTFIGHPTATMTWSGTSMATPHVAGVAAIILGNNKALTPSDVWGRLSADATTDALQDKGELSPDKLLFTDS